MEEIKNLEDFINFEMSVAEMIYKDFGVEWDAEQARKRLIKKYNDIVKPHIDTVGKTIGEINSVFNPVRKVTRVGYYNGDLCVMYKEPRQKLERFQRISR